MPSFQFNETITVIVCSYDEARTIERVILDLLKIPFLSQIIIVDDGSIDETKKILQKYKEKITFLSNESNRGKGYSVARALEIAIGNLVLLLDADIINYTASDLGLLIGPIAEKRLDFTVKIPDNPYFFTHINVSGIRCYQLKDLQPFLFALKRSSKYGLELLLNRALRQKKGAFVKLNDYQHIDKFHKYIFLRAIWEYCKEALSLLRQLIFTPDRGALNHTKRKLPETL
jgi:polyisoprenyl-phosphate glycosyltransferase